MEREREQASVWISNGLFYLDGCMKIIFICSIRSRLHSIPISHKGRCHLFTWLKKKSVSHKGKWMTLVTLQGKTVLFLLTVLGIISVKLITRSSLIDLAFLGHWAILPKCLYNLLESINNLNWCNCRMFASPKENWMYDKEYSGRSLFHLPGQTVTEMKWLFPPTL